MIKAAFFDVDGTLLSHTTRQIPPDTKLALEHLRKTGVKIFMSTGRHILELSHLPVNDIRFDGYIMLNGQLCLDTDRNPVFRSPLSMDASEKLGKIFNERSIPLVMVEEKKIYINFITDKVRKAQADISSPVPVIGEYTGAPLYQATVYLPPREESSFLPLLPEGCKFTRWSPGGADIIPTGGGKVAGIKYFCNHLNIAREETIAFGDAENDLDMLNYAGIGVAMGNAQDHVKQYADYVTEDVDHGGIAKALERFL